MEVCAEGRILFFLVTTLLSSALGAPTLSVDTTPSSYGTSDTLKCTDATYTFGNNYVWEKDSVIIFTQTGEESTTGKYSESIDRTTFKLVINNIDVSDEGTYTCNHGFSPSNSLNLEVESQGNVSAVYLSSKYLEVTFEQIYPNINSTVITCDSTIINGSIVNSAADGDRFIETWKSMDTFLTEPTSCSAEVTLRRRTFTTALTVTSETTTSPTTTPPTTTTTPSLNVTSSPPIGTTTSSTPIIPIISGVCGGVVFLLIISISICCYNSRKKIPENKNLTNTTTSVTRQNVGHLDSETKYL